MNKITIKKQLADALNKLELLNTKDPYGDEDNLELAGMQADWDKSIFGVKRWQGCYRSEQISLSLPPIRSPPKFTLYISSSTSAKIHDSHAKTLVALRCTVEPSLQTFSRNISFSTYALSGNSPLFTTIPNKS